MSFRYTLLLFMLITVEHKVCGQQTKQYFVGYNSFNEVYAGADFPRKNRNRFTLQAGYQIALSQTTFYGSWFQTNNASGVRIRAGYKIPINDKRGEGTLCVENQALQSNTYWEEDIGSSRTEFTESQSKIGIRISNAVPIIQSNVFLTFSIGLFSMNAHRTYLQPQKPDEKNRTTNIQLTAGLKAYIF